MVINEEQPQATWVLKNGNKPLDLRTLPRCRAMAKSTGRGCGNPAMKGRNVCYIHGGKSPGAPKGNQNAFKHGSYTSDSNANRRFIKKFLRQSKKFLTEINCIDQDLIMQLSNNGHDHI